jgi:Ca2+-binding EF-hand superfamily protein
MPAKYNAGSIFAVFRDKDVDRNGFLEWLEYQQCLEALGELADLNKEEGLALNMIADIDGDGRIDYQEFMKHFEEVVYMIKFHNELQEHYDGLPERIQEKMAQQQQ